MKTKKIGLVGGPSTGKSILAAQIYIELRKLNKDARLVLEYATEYIGRFGPPKTALEQLLIFLGQREAENRWWNKCEYEIVETPAFLSCIYARLERAETIAIYGKEKCRHLIKKMDDWARETSIPTFNLLLFLPPLWKFVRDSVRTQNSKTEAEEVSSWINFFLKHEGIEFHTIATKNDRKPIEQALALIKKL